MGGIELLAKRTNERIIISYEEFFTAFVKDHLALLLLVIIAYLSIDFDSLVELSPCAG